MIAALAKQALDLVKRHYAWTSNLSVTKRNLEEARNMLERENAGQAHEVRGLATLRECLKAMTLPFTQVEDTRQQISYAMYAYETHLQMTQAKPELIKLVHDIPWSDQIPQGRIHDGFFTNLSPEEAKVLQDAVIYEIGMAEKRVNRYSPKPREEQIASLKNSVSVIEDNLEKNSKFLLEIIETLNALENMSFQESFGRAYGVTRSDHAKMINLRAVAYGLDLFGGEEKMQYCIPSLDGEREIEMNENAETKRMSNGGFYPVTGLLVRAVQGEIGMMYYDHKVVAKVSQLGILE